MGKLFKQLPILHFLNYQKSNDYRRTSARHQWIAGSLSAFKNILQNGNTLTK